MKQNKTISGFSKLNKRGKIKWIAKNFFHDPEKVVQELKSYWLDNEKQQEILDGFSENTVTNFHLPYGVAPNFIINDKPYCVPMVIEESSVVAAAAAAAKFWLSRGGFKAEIIGTQKLGHVHFIWNGDPQKIKTLFPEIKSQLLKDTEDITANMRKRGGGISDIELIDMTSKKEGYYQLKGSFETCDSMGANFINSNLEAFAQSLKKYMLSKKGLQASERDVTVIMSILSNFTPDCMVRASVECPIEELGSFSGGISAEEFAFKFKTAVDIAHIDPYRATTHNKGIYNGIDAVVLATGNDFRAIEACGHTYAAQGESYSSLSHCSIENGVFKFWLDLPLAIGTVGGLTSLHPIAKRSLELLGNPTAKELMGIIASVGLAQNFAAVRSLVTTGIQQGHMKMHLLNILNHIEASAIEKEKSIKYFADKAVSFSNVRQYVISLR